MFAVCASDVFVAVVASIPKVGMQACASVHGCAGAHVRCDAQVRAKCTGNL